ncbi:hypothetical protein [Nocardia abscessus]|uniref:hypothetical protein n=1 Tax=Nocardia abscessus TaxID=120957 RepID=UPI0003187440|nr:hypothetical protein [Nocardia abscessus]MCC3331421.1 hypothetical protein [Nocardia abscessus]
MSNPLVIADRVEITALCGEVTDAVMIRDFDRVASLFTPDRYQRTPDGWRLSERVYEVRYLDSTPLPGAPLATHH